MHARLLKLNPWARIDSTTSALSMDDTAQQVRRKAACVRAVQGQRAWNEWASAMLSLRPGLEADAASIALWLDLATTDFAGVTFSEDCLFAEYLFPGRADFSGARFCIDAWFNAAEFCESANLSRATFERDGFFEYTKFRRSAVFAQTQWRSDAQFRKSRFQGQADFRGAVFNRDAWFIGSQFEDELVFAGAQFSGEAGLGDCEYRGACDFSRISFRGNAGFAQARFLAPARFDDARFERKAWFKQARFEFRGHLRASAICGGYRFRRGFIQPQAGCNRYNCRSRQTSERWRLTLPISMMQDLR